jgi:pimeloyl-ACP methyl ester carboxylesterase
MKQFFKSIKRMLLLLFSTLLVLLLLLTCILLIYSPGKSVLFLDEKGKPLAGSISEKIHVPVNGMEQGMIIKSKNATHPVLLYLHGGLPDYFLTPKYPTGLEDYFTVVWWEQRGSGLSYDPDIPPKAITLEQLLSDTKEVTNYLRRRFGKEKIYLMGRSGGTFIGIQAAARTPELYHAYIGVAQMTDQLTSEQLAYEYMLEQFKEKGNKKMVRKLEAAPVTTANGTPAAYLALRDKAMHSLGIGTTHKMKTVITGMFLPSLTFREYTLSEKINLWRAKARSGVSVLWDTILVTDLTKQVPEIDIPVYFFHGIYDYTVSYPLAKSYLAQIKAPLKGFYTFNHSAHSPLFEEPVLVRKIIENDVLNGRNSLADNMIIR